MNTCVINLQCNNKFVCRHINIKNKINVYINEQNIMKGNNIKLFYRYVIKLN